MLCALLTHGFRDTILANTIIIGLPLATPLVGAVELYVFTKVYTDTLRDNVKDAI